MKKIGAVSVGQAPSMNIAMDVQAVLGPNVELVQVGLWDNMTLEEIKAYAPKEGEEMLLGRMTDGVTTVLFAEKYVPERLQVCLDKLNAQDVELIMMFCAGSFPKMKSKAPLLQPGTIVHNIVPAMLQNYERSKIMVLIPDGFEHQWYEMWKNVADEVYTMAAWGDRIEEYFKSMDMVAKRADELDVDLIVMDCMGYSTEMKAYLKKVSGRKVVLTRTMLARTAAELLE